MQQRSDNPILPYLAAAVIILFTPILFPFAVLVYKIVRPQEKIGEVYERNLAEEALLAEVEAVHHCPTCERRVDDEWIICPTCRTRLNRVCPNCTRLVGLDWSLCAWCGRDFERREVMQAARRSSRCRRASRRPAGSPRRRATPAVRRPCGRSARSPSVAIAGSAPSAVAARPRPTTADEDPLPERRPLPPGRRPGPARAARRIDVHHRGPRRARRSSSSAGSRPLRRPRSPSSSRCMAGRWPRAPIAADRRLGRCSRSAWSPGPAARPSSGGRAARRTPARRRSSSSPPRSRSAAWSRSSSARS